jgi:hypothetical protein
MGNTTGQTGSGSGAFSTLGAQQQGNITYSVMAEQLTKQLQQSGGTGEFVLVHRQRGSELPTVWSSGDPQQTQALYRAGTEVIEKEPVRT